MRVPWWGWGQRVSDSRGAGLGAESMPSAGRTVPVELVSVPRAVISSVWKSEINI